MGARFGNLTSKVEIRFPAESDLFSEDRTNLGEGARFGNLISELEIRFPAADLGSRGSRESQENTANLSNSRGQHVNGFQRHL